MPESSTPRTTKHTRIRSEKQLNQKRAVDRVKKGENRLQDKNRLSRIESDVADIKNSLQSIMLHLQNIPPMPQPDLIGPAVHQDLMIGPGSPYMPAPLQTAAPHFSPLVPGYQQAQGTLAHWNNRGLSPSQLTALGGQGSAEVTRLINCRCGSQHLDRFDSLDTCNVTALYQRQIMLSHQTLNSQEPIPRTPSLPAMMLYTTEGNIVTYLITGFLQQYRSKSIEQLMAFYLLGYRYMRWQMNPCDETLQDMPPWLLPTDIQKSHPHPVVVDFLPWPDLRNYLCTHTDGDSRHSVNFYFESMVFTWPGNCSLFAQGEGGEVSLGPDFEAVAWNLENWKMGPPFSLELPHLMPLVHA